MQSSLQPRSSFSWFPVTRVGQAGLDPKPMIQYRSLVTNTNLPMANEVTGAVPWQAMVAGQVTFLPTLSLGASKNHRNPGLQEETQRMHWRQMQRFPSILTQDDTQPVEGMKPLCSQTRTTETRDVKAAGRLVSSTEETYGSFPPRTLEWMLLTAWWSVPPVWVSSHLNTLNFQFISDSPLLPPAELLH